MTACGNVLKGKKITLHETLAWETDTNSFDAVCGGEVSGPEGEIRSPGYPHGYPSWRLCEWVITAPIGKRIKLEFLDFDMTNTGPGGNIGHRCRDNIQVMSRKSCSSN